jgi:hypothetical protein
LIPIGLAFSKEFFMRAKYYAFAAMIAVMASPAFADGYYSSPWIFSVSVGSDVPVSGEIFNAADSNVATLSALNANLSGTGILHLKGKKYSDLYYPSAKISFEVRYALSDLSEIYGSAGYLKAQSKGFQDLGCLEVGANVCATQLIGHVNDLTQYTLELGYRSWFGTGFISEAIRPYWAVHGGIARTNAGHMYLAAGNDPLAHWNQYKASTQLTFGGDLGATYTVSSNSELAAEIGVRYTGKLKANPGDLASWGLEEALDDSHLVSIPVTLRYHTTF